MGRLPAPARRWLLALAAVGVVAAGVALARGGADDVHPLPPPGEVAGVALSDGRPAFVVHHADGEVAAFAGRAPVAAAGQRGLLSWCEPNAVFVDPLHGHSWQRDGTGRILRGTTPRSDRASGNPPPPMVALPVEASSDLARIEAVAADPLEHPPPFARSSCDRDAAVRPPLPGGATTWAAFAEQAADGLPAGTHRLEALLEQHGGTRPRLCAATAPRCGRDGLELALPASPHLAEGLVARYRGALAVSVRDGRVTEVLLGDVGGRRVSRARPDAAPTGSR